VISQVLADAFSALNSRDRGLPFSALDLIPLLGDFALVEPELTFGQFFDFRLGLFNLPYPVQAKLDLCDPGLSSRNLIVVLFGLVAQRYRAVQQRRSPLLCEPRSSCLNTFHFSRNKAASSPVHKKGNHFVGCYRRGYQQFCA
jgi:hypothetical protein